jgi:hypothetical protein
MDAEHQASDLQLWVNARIWNEHGPFHQALCIRQGRILALGSEAEMRQFAWSLDAEPLVLDQQGAYVYPGFRDPHAHFLYLGLASYQADLNNCSGPEAVVQRLQDFAEKTPVEGRGGDWLLGRDWNDSAWPAGARLDRNALDAAFPDRPVYLSRVDRHAAVVNSEALRRAGLERARPVAGGHMEAINGRLSGLLIDEAMQLVRVHVPETPPEQAHEALLRAQAHCLQAGLVGVADMGLSWTQYQGLLAAYQDGTLKLPIYGTLTPDAETEAYFRREGPQCFERLTLRAFKYYADGALGSRGAKLFAPYSDAPSGQGLWMHPPEYLHAQARLNADQGFQTVTHAIGDAAVRLVLDVVERAAPPPDHRWRVEHAQLVHPDDLPCFARLGAWASVQACHGVSDRLMAGFRVGGERLAHAYRARTLLDAGARLVNGTDFPIEPVSPLRSFVAACLRVERDALLPGEGPGSYGAVARQTEAFRPEEALTRREALLAMTAWTAEAQFQEAECGRLEPGQWADCTLLDIDLMTAGPEALAAARVLGTVVRGEQLYAAD